MQRNKSTDAVRVYQVFDIVVGSQAKWADLGVFLDRSRTNYGRRFDSFFNDRFPLDGSRSHTVNFFHAEPQTELVGDLGVVSVKLVTTSPPLSDSMFLIPWVLAGMRLKSTSNSDSPATRVRSRASVSESTRRNPVKPSGNPESLPLRRGP